jgi:hypothetical protein
MPLLEVSYGEVADRFCILSIKASRLAREKAATAADELSAVMLRYPFLCDGSCRHIPELLRVNAELWDAVAQCREAVSSGSVHTRSFIEASRAVVELNDERYKIKRAIESDMPAHVSEVKEI